VGGRVAIGTAAGLTRLRLARLATAAGLILLCTRLLPRMRGAATDALHAAAVWTGKYNRRWRPRRNRFA